MSRQVSDKADSARPGTKDGEAVRERFEGQFFKTKLCVFWEKGRCVRGSSCKYAHGHNELQAMPDLTNTAMCRMLAETGRCNRPNCLYAHNHESLRATDNFYKTTMCSFFRYGRCRLGALCRHAHSESELRKINEEPEQPEQAVRRDRAYDSTSASGSGNDLDEEPRQKIEDSGLVTDDGEDDFDDITWERISTMPATLGHRTGALPPNSHGGSMDDNWYRERNLGNRGAISTRNKLLWADLQEEDDEVGVAGQALNPVEPSMQAATANNLPQADSFDDLPEMDNMWARIETMPARTFSAPSGPQMMMPMTPKQQVVMMMVPVSQAQMMMAPSANVPGAPQPMMANFVQNGMQSPSGSWEQGAMLMPAQIDNSQASMMVPAQCVDGSGMPPMCMPAMCVPMKDAYAADAQPLGG